MVLQKRETEIGSLNGEHEAEGYGVERVVVEGNMESVEIVVTDEVGKPTISTIGANQSASEGTLTVRPNVAGSRSGSRSGRGGVVINLSGIRGSEVTAVGGSTVRRIDGPVQRESGPSLSVKLPAPFFNGTIKMSLAQGATIKRAVLSRGFVVIEGGAERINDVDWR